MRLVSAMVGRDPVRRLVLAHAAGVAGDALFTVSLADSLFFNVSVEAARPSILLYLLLTLAPFGVVAPFVGPLIDRFLGSQRVVIAATNTGRAVVIALVAWQHTSLLFFPLAFTVLVLGKAASVAKSSLVPWLVRDDAKLVAENARLSRFTTIAGVAAGAAGVLLLRFTIVEVVIVGAAVLHVLALPLALRIPRVRVRGSGPVVDDVELGSGALPLAANAMSALRAGVGFLVFLLAFNLKIAGEPAWLFGAVIAAAGTGGFVGTYLAAVARRLVREEALIAVALGASGGVALITAAQYERSGVFMVSFTVGACTSMARQAFDSLTQRLAPDAEKGRAFARFETRFQVAWVVGALLPVLFRPNVDVGLAVFGIGAIIAVVAYGSGLRSLRRQQLVVQAALDPAEDDLPRSMLTIANALHAQGAHRLAVVTAVEAVRIATATAPTVAVPDDLEAIWELAVDGTGALPAGLAAQALALARVALAERGSDRR